MTRVGPGRLVQRVDDLLVLVDEDTGDEVTLTDAHAFRQAVRDGDRTFEHVDTGDAVTFTEDEVPRVLSAVAYLFPDS